MNLHWEVLVSCCVGGCSIVSGNGVDGPSLTKSACCRVGFLAAWGS